MSIEEDMFNAFKYANFGGGMSPQQMIKGILKNVEVTMLRRMQKQIETRIKLLDGADKSLDPFEILGVSEDSTKEEVIRAYREKARIAHPDTGGNHEDMAKVNAARDAIFLFKGWKS